MTQRLSSFLWEANNYWAFGSEWLPTGYDNWNLPSNYLRIKNEEIANWIKKKVQTILAEFYYPKIKSGMGTDIEFQITYNF